jgi:arsenate reductase
MTTTLLQTIADMNIAVISKERIKILDLLVAFIQEKKTAQAPIKLHFICTHNSRRSHLSQIWAQAMAAYYKVPHVLSYSGGTEATAMYPMVVETLGAQGFEIHPVSEGVNPVYSIHYSENGLALLGFSKTLDHAVNPSNGFAAIMTCDAADQGCPFIAGAEQRIGLTYKDPKASDGTPQQESVYLERSIQIATELKYVFSRIS